MITVHKFIGEIGIPYTKSVVEELERRFPQVGVLGSIRVLSSRSYESLTAKAIINYGIQEISQLASHFGKPREYKAGVRFRHLLRETDAVQEFNDFKFFVHQNLSKLDQNEFLQIFFKDFSQLFPNTKRLMDLCMAVPFSTVDCERGFSRLNLIKTRPRNRLTTHHLDQLMRVSIEGMQLICLLDSNIFLGHNLTNADLKQSLHHFFAKTPK
jgi:hypothetical protein